MSAGDRLYYSTATEFPGSGLANDAAYQIGPGVMRFFQLGGYNPPGLSNSDYFVFLFDATSASAGDTGFQQFSVPVGASFSWDPSLEGLKMSQGLLYAISTTPGQYTASSGASLFLYCQYVDLTP